MKRTLLLLLFLSGCASPKTSNVVIPPPPTAQEYLDMINSNPSIEEVQKLMDRFGEGVNRP